MTTTQVIARIRALSRQQDRCLWHTRSSRCQLEQIRNELRGDTSLVAETVARGHTASFWCSCKAASQASAVFSADVEAADDDVVMKRWKAASLGAQAVTSSTPRETLRAASGSVPLARELVGTFVGKQGIRITALQMELNGGGRAPKGHYNERVVLTVRELPLLGTFEVAFVCAEKRLSDVSARLVRAIEDAKIKPARKSASRVSPACREKRATGGDDCVESTACSPVARNRGGRRQRCGAAARPSVCTDGLRGVPAAVPAVPGTSGRRMPDKHGIPARKWCTAAVWRPSSDVLRRATDGLRAVPAVPGMVPGTSGRRMPLAAVRIVCRVRCEELILPDVTAQEPHV